MESLRNLEREVLLDALDMYIKVQTWIRTSLNASDAERDLATMRVTIITSVRKEVEKNG